MEKITVRYTSPTKGGAVVFGRRTFQRTLDLHMWLFNVPSGTVIRECRKVGVPA